MMSQLYRKQPGKDDGAVRGVEVYVAGPSRAWPECRTLSQELVHYGYTITHDWTQEFAEPAHRLEGMLWPALPAEQDYRGVKNANAIVALVLPFVPTTGMNKPVIAWLDYTNSRSLDKAELADQDQYLKAVKEWFDQQVFLQAPGVEVVTRQDQVFTELYNATLRLYGPDSPYRTHING